MKHIQWAMCIFIGVGLPVAPSTQADAAPPTAAPSSAMPGTLVTASSAFSYSLQQVQFRTPRRVSVGAGNQAMSQGLRLVVRGQDFRPAATGPVVILNGITSRRTTVSSDGSSLEAWFYLPLSELESAARRLGHWELVVEPHAGAPVRLRISPTGQAADLGRKPVISARVE